MLDDSTDMSSLNKVFGSAIKCCGQLVANVFCVYFSSRGHGASIMDILRDGIFWNTPKKRKSIERRMTERYGSKEWGTLKTLQVVHPDS